MATLMDAASTLAPLVGIAPACEALQLVQRLHEPAREAIVLNQLGLVFQNWGKRDDAERNYRESARIAESQENWVRAAGTWDQLGQGSALSGRFQAAEAWFHKAVQARRQVGDVVGLARSLSNLASFLEQQPSRLAEARQLAEEALAIRKTLDPGAAAIWDTYTILARIAQKQNNPVQAREYHLKAREAWRNFDGSS